MTDQSVREQARAKAKLIRDQIPESVLDDDDADDLEEFLIEQLEPLLAAKAEAERQRDEARATKDMHKDRQQDEIERAMKAWQVADALAAKLAAVEAWLDMDVTMAEQEGRYADGHRGRRDSVRAALALHSEAKRS